MVGGLTAVVTLCKPENRILGVKPEDEQLHVLSHYAPDKTDEFDSFEGQNYKVRNGEVEHLEKFERKLVSRMVAKKSARAEKRKFSKNYQDLEINLTQQQFNQSQPAISIQANHVTVRPTTMVYSNSPYGNIGGQFDGHDDSAIPQLDGNMGKNHMICL